MDIHSFFEASTSSSVASSSTHIVKGSNCSDSDSDIAEPPSKKACREWTPPSTMNRNYSKNWETKFSWLEMMIFAGFVNRPQQRAPHTTGGGGSQFTHPTPPTPHPPPPPLNVTCNFSTTDPDHMRTTIKGN